jgi:hypothetical protein
VQHAGQAVEEGAFPGPVRPNNGADFTPPHFKIDIVEGRQSAETDGQALSA